VSIPAARVIAFLGNCPLCQYQVRHGFV